MIVRFRHAGLERFFKTGSASGIQPAHRRRLRLILTTLNTAGAPRDMGLPGLDLHPLKGGPSRLLVSLCLGELEGCFSVRREQRNRC